MAIEIITLILARERVGEGSPHVPSPRIFDKQKQARSGCKTSQGKLAKVGPVISTLCFGYFEVLPLRVVVYIMFVRGHSARLSVR